MPVAGPQHCYCQQDGLKTEQAGSRRHSAQPGAWTPRCQGWLPQPQHHLPGRSQLMLNPQLGDLSCQSGRLGAEEELPQPCSLSGSHGPHALPPPSTGRHRWHCCLRGLSPLQGLGRVMDRCQGKTRAGSRSPSHGPQLVRPCAWSKGGGMVGGMTLIGCPVSAGIRSAHSCPKSHTCPPTPERLLAQKFQTDTAGAGSRPGRNRKQAATVQAKSPFPA